MAKTKEEGVQIPPDLAVLSDDELSNLSNAVQSEFDVLDGKEDFTDGDLARAGELAEYHDKIQAQITANAAKAADLQASREELKSRMKGKPAADEEDEDEEKAAVELAEGESLEVVTASGQRRKVDVRDVLKSGNRLNINWAKAQETAGQAQGHQPAARAFDASVLIASADIPGVSQGAKMENMIDLAKAFHARARSMPIGKAIRGNPIMGHYRDAGTGTEHFGLLGYDGDWRNAMRVPVASLQREFKHVIADGGSPDEVFALMQQAARPDALVASGGWCSPSEIRYDFYNIAAMDGAVDLPTVGVSRGGLRWPTSPAFGDLASSTGLWHWTETQDIAAATGTAQSGTKTCAHIPCAAMNEVRLEGEGICITAGNLSTDSWPEQLANYLRLVNAAHFHRINLYFVNNLVSQSTAVTLTQTNSSPVTDLLSGIEHQAWDLRTKYAMNDNDVLEVVLPNWTKGLLRADISRRSGMANADSSFTISDAMMAAWFTLRNISVQWVQDFDVRGANQFGQASALSAAWPATVRFIIYPAGTWLRVNGMNLDLGIIRDSTLNATNDYTAAWSEEFFSLAKIGHESRIVTLGASGSVPTGTTAIGLTATGV